VRALIVSLEDIHRAPANITKILVIQFNVMVSRRIHLRPNLVPNCWLPIFQKILFVRFQSNELSTIWQRHTL